MRSDVTQTTVQGGFSYTPAGPFNCPHLASLLRFGQNNPCINVLELLCACAEFFLRSSRLKAADSVKSSALLYFPTNLEAVYLIDCVLKSCGGDNHWG